MPIASGRLQKWAETFGSVEYQSCGVGAAHFAAPGTFAAPGPQPLDRCGPKTGPKTGPETGFEISSHIMIMQIQRRKCLKMSENVTNKQLLEQLKAVRTELSDLTNGKADIRTALVGIRQHMTGFMTGLSSHESAIAAVHVRLDRIERRLDLTDAPAE